MKTFVIILISALSVLAAAAEKPFSLKATNGQTVEVSLEEIRKAVVPAYPDVYPNKKVGHDGRITFSWPQVRVGEDWKYVDAAYPPSGAIMFCKMLGYSRFLGDSTSSLGLAYSLTDGRQTVARLGQQSGTGKTDVTISQSGFVYSEISCEL